MTDRTQWQQFFDGHAPEYMNNCFTRNTKAEVDFLLEEMKLPTGSFILDIGCGTGRHSVEFAKRGYHVTGVDISAGMLSEAEKAASEAGVSVEWIQADATCFTASRQFDAAICLCEGAFALLNPEDDPIEHDLAILKNIHAALKTGAPFVLTTLNGYRFARQHNSDDIVAGVFDPLTLTVNTPMEIKTPEGAKTVRVKERGYVPTEIWLLFRIAGFQVMNIWGGTAGNWNRRAIDLDEIEFMVVGIRK